MDTQQVYIPEVERDEEEEWNLEWNLSILVTYSSYMIMMLEGQIDKWNDKKESLGRMTLEPDLTGDGAFKHRVI